MRWETIASAPDNEVYHLYKDDKKILTLTLHPFSISARWKEKQKKEFSSSVKKDSFAIKQCCVMSME